MPALDFVAQPITKLYGSLTVPGDKSISHRALLLASIAEGTSTIYNCLYAEDTLALIKALGELGVQLTFSEQALVLQGVGQYGFNTPKQPLDLGNSGTALRLLTAILAGQGVKATLQGDVSLNKRPMARIIQPLQAMGAVIKASETDTPPLQLEAVPISRSLQYEMPLASAQVKTAILLAALYAKGRTTVIEAIPTRDHLERMLPAFGVTLKVQAATISLQGLQTLSATHLTVPADLSAAAFFIVAACISQKAAIQLPGVNINPSRLGIIPILRQMGAKIRLSNIRFLNNEPVADIYVENSKLTAVTLDKEQVAFAIDEIPVLCIAAACAKGKTYITGADELRHKESDRIKVMLNGLNRLGIAVEELPDGLIIEGGKLQGGQVDSAGDHRVAMAFSIAAAAASEPIYIQNCANVATSFPNFLELAEQVGFNISSV